MSATDFVAEYADTSALTSCCLSWLELKLRVNFLLKTFECFYLVSLAIFFRFSYTLVIKTTLFR